MKIFITGRDNSGWALDQEAGLAAACLSEIESVELTDNIEFADCIYSVWWEVLPKIHLRYLETKYIICSMCNEPFHEFKNPLFSVMLQFIDKIVVQTAEAQEQLKTVGIDSFLIPYQADIVNFFRLNIDKIQKLKKQWQIPEDKYILGNFHRDTEGADLSKAKKQKGADVLLEIIRKVWQYEKNIHVLLAGPRRHWLKNNLKKDDIPFTYIGTETEGDDYQINILDLETINQLYNTLDLAIVSSRWEGAPRTIMEAIASGTKVISTPVGVAPDLLDQSCIYNNFTQAAEIILKDIKTDYLSGFQNNQLEKLRSRFTHEYALSRFNQLINDINPSQKKVNKNTSGKFLVNHKTNKKKTNLTVWHQFFKPPYGGGNQFIMALTNEIKRKGHCVFENMMPFNTDCYLLNSVHFDVEKFKQHRQKKGSIPVLHRMDGPLQIYRGTDTGLDKMGYEINQQLASFTVLQSSQVMVENARLGYYFKNPVIINNTIDPAIFHSKGKRPFDPSKKIKLVSASWSANQNKGFSTYQWLDQNLDFSRYEFTFIGNSPVIFKNIKQMTAVDSKRLSEIFREQDIFIFASRYEACSNVIIEAMACGLPVVYYNKTSNPEIVGTGGLPFLNDNEIPIALKLIEENYQAFQNLLWVDSINEVANKYLETINRICFAFNKHSIIKKMIWNYSSPLIKLYAGLKKTNRLRIKVFNRLKKTIKND